MLLCKIISLKRETIADLKGVVDRDPDDADAHYRLGIAYLKIGHADNASTALNRAISLGAQDADVYCSLGEAFLLLKLYGQAIEACQESLKIAANAAAYFIMCDAYVALGNYKGAIDACRQAIVIDPEGQRETAIETYYTLGVVCYNDGYYEEALEAFRELLSINPDHSEASAMIDKARFMAGELD